MKYLLIQINAPEASIWSEVLDRSLAIFISMAVVVLMGWLFKDSRRYWQETIKEKENSILEKDKKLYEALKENLIVYQKISASIERNLTSGNKEQNETLRSELKEIKEHFDNKMNEIRNELRIISEKIIK